MCSSDLLFAPSCVTVTTAASEEPSSPTVVSRDIAPEPQAAPAPAWGRDTTAPTSYGASVG